MRLRRWDFNKETGGDDALRLLGLHLRRDSIKLHPRTRLQFPLNVNRRSRPEILLGSAMRKIGGPGR